MRRGTDPGGEGSGRRRVRGRGGLPGRARLWRPRWRSIATRLLGPRSRRARRSRNDGGGPGGRGRRRQRAGRRRCRRRGEGTALGRGGSVRDRPRWRRRSGRDPGRGPRHDGRGRRERWRARGAGCWRGRGSSRRHGLGDRCLEPSGHGGHQRVDRGGVLVGRLRRRARSLRLGWRTERAGVRAPRAGLRRRVQASRTRDDFRLAEARLGDGGIRVARQVGDARRCLVIQRSPPGRGFRTQVLILDAHDATSRDSPYLTRRPGFSGGRPAAR